ncbi:ABC transporter permease [Microbacterium sp. X-17]|uniref:ABC transporter permease n=1 Tax=Microbacterium sp. X-17 TaxID=3144404 RepID=UPI0031F499D8
MTRLSPPEPATKPRLEADRRPETAPVRTSSASKQEFVSDLLRISITPAAFVVIFLIYGLWLGSTFANVQLRMLDIHQQAPVLLLVLAVLPTITVGMFDLSVASMASLTATLTISLVINNDLPFPLVLAICLVVGLAGGLLNGILVEQFGMHTFIATLGTGGLFLGISNVISGAAQLSPVPGGLAPPAWFSGEATSFGNYSSQIPAWLGWCLIVATAVFLAHRLAHVLPLARRTSWIIGIAVSAAMLVVLAAVGWLTQIANGISWMIFFLIVVALLLWIAFEHTPYGRYARALGSNRDASRLAGVKVRRVGIGSFVLGGLLAAIAGIVLAAAQDGAAPDAAGSFLLPAFAAVFLSTVIFSRGRFTVWGALTGGIFLVWVGQGLAVGGFPYTWTQVVNGAVLILAVGASLLMGRRFVFRRRSPKS